jgi:hypothetical protein
LNAVQILILALILASPLAAQDVYFNGDVASDSPPSTPSQSTYAPSPQKSERVFDKKFFFVMGSLGSAESLRFTSRKLVLEREYAAGAPWVTSVPSNQHIVAKDLLLFSSEVLVAYELKKSHSWLPGDRVIRRLWWVYPAAMTAFHIKNGIGNIRTQGPGGCTSIECALQTQTQ